MSPSDLPFWGWLLVGVGCAFVSAIAWASIDNTKNGCLPILIQWISGFCAFVAFVIGFIRFIKWVWAG